MNSNKVLANSVRRVIQSLDNRSPALPEFTGVKMFCTQCRTMQYRYSLPDEHDYNHKCSYCILPQQMDEKPWNRETSVEADDYQILENQRSELASNMALDLSDSLEMLPEWCEFAVGVKLDLKNHAEDLFGQSSNVGKDITYPFGNHPEDTEPQGMIEYHYAVYRDLQKMDAIVEMKKYQMEQLEKEDIWLNKKAEGFENSDPEKARASQVARVERVYHRFAFGETLTEVRFVKPKAPYEIMFDIQTNVEWREIGKDKREMDRVFITPDREDGLPEEPWNNVDNKKAFFSPSGLLTDNPLVIGQQDLTVVIDPINPKLRKIRERIDHEDDNGYDLIPWSEERMMNTFVRPTWETLEIAGRPWDTPFGNLPDIVNPETDKRGEVAGFSRFQREKTWIIHVFPSKKHLLAVENASKKRTAIRNGTHATQKFEISLENGEVGYWSLYWLNYAKEGNNHPAVLKKLGITNGEPLVNLAKFHVNLAQWKQFNWFSWHPKTDEQFEKACKQYLVPNIQKEIEVKTS